MDVFFYEAFAEEAKYLKQYLPSGIAAEFTWKTIQEYDAAEPPAGLISIRTQSVDSCFLGHKTCRHSDPQHRL